MWIRIIEGISIPFIGTVLGAACVLFMRPAAPDIGTGVRKKQALTGFAAGIMVAASFFSLLIPSIEYSDGMGKLSFVPAVTGFLVGMLFMLALDVLIPHIHSDKSEEGLRSGLSKTTKLVLAVTLHNIPEGAIVSMPLRAEGLPKGRTFLYGVLSGAVEPAGAIVMILAAGILLPVLPYLLAFAAGAMLYVVVEELVPDMARSEHSNVGTVCFALGAAVMICLDVGLG